MWLRSVFKMRASILNTATTEQMGYGIISFFVCFLLMNLTIHLPSKQKPSDLPPYPSLRLLHSFLLEPKHRKKKQYHIPDVASERV